MKYVIFFSTLLTLACISCEKETCEKGNLTDDNAWVEQGWSDDRTDNNQLIKEDPLEGADEENDTMTAARILVAPDLQNILISANLLEGNVESNDEELDNLIIAYFGVAIEEAGDIRLDLVAGFAAGEFDHLGFPIVEIEPGDENELRYAWLE